MKGKENFAGTRVPPALIDSGESLELPGSPITPVGNLAGGWIIATGERTGKKGKDVARILGSCGENRAEPSWFASKSNTTAVWVRGNEAMRVSGSGSGADYVWVKVGTVIIVSVYLSRNYSTLEYANRLADIEDTIRDIPGNTIVAGDFNARAIEWGMSMTNRHGRLLLEMAARLKLVVVNEATFRRSGWGQSIPDMTLATDRLLTRIRGWKVIKEYTVSDHEYIVFKVTDENTTRRREKNSTDYCKTPFTETTRSGMDHDSAEKLAEEAEKYLHHLFEATMPKKRYGRDRRQMYWWTQKIADIRRECHRRRRQAQRQRNRHDEEASEAYKLARKRLRAITDSKRQCWT
ncbi:uncharacterized protein LOC131671742 [Phymastichus coffea]|uniref:uncharacterized protein LOC131671742 n=1 Tax=Phymastichus coffea TaxID=108790 RepID=UPI00273ADF82|nr:uncharacterized protein LOC131671742 [Phymastichus coffea]